eukprot:CAMPEP_0198285470 /NCGR_PEP_ID=MMETSP1449-20131203/4733_1 /TAXON_ID=420275 /ORGANISM="Attheya septentrionalis, Strain CCMP2084" /LENGTH=396 /DNA_ID=CAMNT_0043982879 /DNA_START=137 /DNA_END=1327 /DNA_ORIENTATION=-
MPQPNLLSDEFYAILGCDKNADDGALKKAYRKLAVKWHPDKNPGNEQATKNFQKISEAYATLSDPPKRKLYDQYGKEGSDAADHMSEEDMKAQGGFPGGGFPGGFSGGGFPGGGGGGSGVHHMSPEEANRVFSQFFGGSDPFGGAMGGMGGMGGGPGGPNMSFSSSMGGGGGRGGPPMSSFRSSGMGGGVDPFEMMFSQGGMGSSMGSMGGSSTGRGGMDSMRASRAQPAPKRFDAIPSGTVVSLKELQNAPERNGDRGVVKQYIPQSGRYIVVLEDSEETMSVKPNNLLQHVHVHIHDIQSQPELNGKTGTIIAWNPNKERYSIYVMALKKVVSIKPGNVVLETGTVGQITNLQSKPELNGKWGTVKDWIRESNKYDVQLSPQHVIRIKVENMRV